jgi:hypothetical protein
MTTKQKAALLLAKLKRKKPTEPLRLLDKDGFALSDKDGNALYVKR